MRVKCRQFLGRPLSNSLYPDIFLNTPVSVQSFLGRDFRFRFTFVILIVLLRMQGEEWCPPTGSSWPPCRALPGGCWRRAGSGPGTSSPSGSTYFFGRGPCCGRILGKMLCGQLLNSAQVKLQMAEQ